MNTGNKLLTVGELIDRASDSTQGIQKMFERWEQSNTPAEVAGLLGIPKIEKGEIHVQALGNRLSERAKVYACIGGENCYIGFSDAQRFSNGNNLGTFHGEKGTKFEGVRQQFREKQYEDLDAQFKKWIRKELAEKYPEDYKEEKNDEENVVQAKTSNGIEYTISGGTIEANAKDRYIEVMLGGKKYRFGNYGFSQKGDNFTVYLRPFSEVENKVSFQMRKQTEFTSKNMKDAVDKMLRHIDKMLPKLQSGIKRAIVDEIEKYQLHDNV